MATAAPFPLTPKQRAALHYIAGCREAHGRSPTMREIAAAAGCAGKRSGHFRVAALLERGALVRQGRSFLPAMPVAIPRAPDGAPLHFVEIGLASKPGQAPSGAVGRKIARNGRA